MMLALLVSSIGWLLLLGVTITITIPACAGCCEPCLPDGTMLNLTLAGQTFCFPPDDCVEGSMGRYKFINPEDVLGIFSVTLDSTAPFTSSLIATLQAQLYSDSSCAVPDGDPVDVEVTANVVCENGLYSVTIGYTDPTDPGVATSVFANLVPEPLDTVLLNTNPCSGSFTIDTAELSLP